jgi:hypothetical protein
MMMVELIVKFCVICTPLCNRPSELKSVFCQKVLTRIFDDFDFSTHFNRDEYYTHAVNRI